MVYLFLKKITKMVEEKENKYIIIQVEKLLKNIFLLMEEDESSSKLICEAIIPFEQTVSELWLQFESINEYREEEQRLYDVLKDSEGNDTVIIYCTKEKV